MNTIQIKMNDLANELLYWGKRKPELTKEILSTFMDLYPECIPYMPTLIN